MDSGKATFNMHYLQSSDQLKNIEISTELVANSSDINLESELNILKLNGDSQNYVFI